MTFSSKKHLKYFMAVTWVGKKYKNANIKEEKFANSKKGVNSNKRSAGCE